MIEYTTKKDSGVTFAMFTSEDVYFEVPVTNVAESDRQSYLQNVVEEYKLDLERVS